MAENKDLVSGSGADLALRQTGSLLSVTDRILARRRSQSKDLAESDAWLDELIAWADENMIPKYIFPRDKQEILNLSDLNLSIDNWSKIPDSITLDLENFKEWILWNNKLSEIPDSIGNLHNLTKLDFSMNKLSEIPDSIGNLNDLTELNLWGNKLSKIPDTIGNLHNLTDFYLLHNNLSEIPDSIGNLHNLEELDLGNNQIISLPSSLGKLTKLKELNLRDNPIKRLPPELSHLRDITKFD